MRFSILALTAGLLAPAAVAGPVVTDTFGGTGSHADGRRDFKLNRFEVSEPIRLIDFEVELEPRERNVDVYFVLYRRDGTDFLGTPTWARVWHSGQQRISGGRGFKRSPPLDRRVMPGEYALGVYLTRDQARYWYQDVGQEPVDWGVRAGSLYFGNNVVWSFLSSFSSSPSAHGYSQRVTVELLEDLDGDGFYDDEDCDDTDPDTFPGAPELCDGVDNDCDGIVDNDVVWEDWYGDRDGDGYGDPADVMNTCDGPPPGYVANDADCDDTDPDTFPGAPELCDGVDNDCDGIPDNAVQYEEYYRDADGDGYGDPTDRVETCDGAPAGYVSNADDCDDTRTDVFSGAPELCDGLDNDCNGLIDDGLAFTIWYLDNDGDGYGVEDQSLATCDATPPSGYAAVFGDCDDTRATAFPGAPELCNDLDDDCNGLIDDDVVYTDWFPDHDGDGYGAGEPIHTCEGQPAGYVDNDDDCDDSRSSVYPGAPELCDGLDNDCDGAPGPDEGDSDGDGVIDCLDCAPQDASIYPGAEEICGDDVDQDCDGVAPVCESDVIPFATEALRAGCSCSASPAAPWGLMPLLVALFPVLRRRGSPPGGAVG